MHPVIFCNFLGVDIFQADGILGIVVRYICQLSDIVCFSSVRPVT